MVCAVIEWAWSVTLSMHGFPNWIKYQQYPLEFYIDRLANKKYFAMPVYGDGEWMCLVDDSKMISDDLDGDNHPLIASTFKNNINKPNVYYGTSFETIYRCIEEYRIQEIADYFEKNKAVLQNINWNDGRIILLKFIEGKLFPFIKQLRKMRIVVIGNNKLKKLNDKVFDYDHFIGITKSRQRGYDFIGIIEDGIRKYGYKKDTVFLFACGHAAPVVIQRMFPEMPDNYFMDVGKGFDYFCDHGNSITGLLNIPNNIKEGYPDVPVLTETMINNNLR